MDQTKGILDNLNTSLNDSKTALESTGMRFRSTGKLNSVTADLNALRSSQSYQDFLNLTGLDSEAVSEFMSAPVALKNRVLLSGEKLWERHDSVLYKPCHLGRGDCVDRNFQTGV